MIYRVVISIAVLLFALAGFLLAPSSQTEAPQPATPRAQQPAPASGAPKSDDADLKGFKIP